MGSIPDVSAFSCGGGSGGGVASVMIRGGSAGCGWTADGGGGGSGGGGGGAPTNGVAPAGRGGSATGGRGGGGRGTSATVGAPSRAGPAAGAYGASFFSQTTGNEPLLVPFIPSVALRLWLYSSGGASSDASTVISQAVVREEVILFEMGSRRTYSAAFRDWCGAHSANVAGIRIAVAALQTRLLGLVSDGGGEGASVFQTV